MINKTTDFIKETIEDKKYYIYLLVLINFFTGLSGVINAFILKELINSAVDKKYDSLKIYAILLVVTAIFFILLRALERQIKENANSTFENLFKNRLFKNILNRSYEKVMKTHSGEWMNKLTSDTVVVSSGLVNILPGLMGMLVMLLAAIISIVWLVPKVMIIIIPGGLLMLILSYFFRKKLKLLHKNIQENDGKLRIFLQERISNLLIVKAFSKEVETLNDANMYMANHKKARMDRIAFSNMCNVGYGFVMRLLYIISAIYCAYGIYRGDISYGTFVAVIQLVSQIQHPISSITGFVPQYYSLVSSSERLMEVEGLPLDGEQLSIEEINTFYKKKFRKLGFKHVNFAYDENFDVLHDFNLEVKKGQIVVLKGKSGIGKSTALKLLMNLYETEGLYINKDVLDYRYRKLFAYVPQGNQLLAGNIKEIVSFNGEVDEERIKEALKIAKADEFITDLNQVVGEKGSGLSEGQVQRLAIARAIYSNRPILLLDEATSSLDEKTEKEVLKNIHELTDKTVIIVTHKKAALKVADEVYDL